ncbi:MAG TPA: hypothetical protein VMU61_12665 [Candidatus Aquilonibacter sp.]|nr:hypothetical protein [Candidatus Aquilonibacter sp.]
MKRKTLAVTLVVLASLLLGTNAFAITTNNCSSGTNLKFVGVGSSAQINALGAAAATLLLATPDNAYSLITFKTASITDKRTGLTDTGLTAFVVWDPVPVTCDAYVYFQTDSGVGDKDFFAYEKFTGSSTVTGKQHFNSVAAAYATVPTGTFTPANVIAGMTDGCWTGSINGTSCGAVNQIPSTISTALNTTPESYLDQNGAGVPPGALSYCGNVSSVAVTSQFYCYFNAAGTDIRPEDALYAFKRALAPYNGAVPATGHGGTLTGLGYGASAGCTGGTATIGCAFLDSFNQGSKFFTALWALSGSDPISKGTLPKYTTFNVGAVPVVVIAGNEDTGNLGSTYTDAAHNTNYTYNNINRQILAQVFSGYIGCLGDLQATAAGPAAPGAAIPLQVIEREAQSGTYNSMEFTGVRTQQGGPLASTHFPNANADSGQEQFNDPNVFPSHTGGTDCSFSSALYPSANCFNPLFLSYDGTDIKVGSNCQGHANGTAPGLPVRLRAIGTGQLVKATSGRLNVAASSSTKVFNPISYSFWGFGNLGPLCSTISGTSCNGTPKWLGHYLTVDGIDPLFITPGGEFDPTPNPSGPYNPPVCDFTAPCPTIPFTHILDGSYPLWQILRTVTFAPVTGKINPPPAVLDMIANEEKTADAGTLSDYVPFLTNITGTIGSGNYTGDLNLFVFRSHFEQTGLTVKPANGHIGCTGAHPFTGVSLQGGTSTSSTCLVDFGNDVGGSVLTVQEDVDFIADFGTEEYYLRQ